MKYQLMIRARPWLDKNIPELHERFVSALEQIESGWGLTADERPVLKDKKHWSESGTQVSLKGFLGRGIKGQIRYMSRETIDFYIKRFGEKHVDEGMYDDYLGLEFDPEKVDYQALAEVAFTKYIEVLAPYEGMICHDEFGHLDFEEWRKLPTRGAVYRVCPVSFWDKELCRRAFNLTPEEIKDRLSHKIERVSLFTDGVLIIASSRILALHEADEINRQLKPLLTGTPVPPPDEQLRLALEESREQAAKKTKSVSKKPGKKQTKARNRSLVLAKAVIEAMMFLELSDDETVDFDAAVKQEEAMAYILRSASEEEQANLRSALAELEQAEREHLARPEIIEFLRNFMDYLGLPDQEDE